MDASLRWQEGEGNGDYGCFASLNMGIYAKSVVI
jgi:hypothetical protein